MEISAKDILALPEAEAEKAIDGLVRQLSREQEARKELEKRCGNLIDRDDLNPVYNPVYAKLDSMYWLISEMINHYFGLAYPKDRSGDMQIAQGFRKQRAHVNTLETLLNDVLRELVELDIGTHD